MGFPWGLGDYAVVLGGGFNISSMVCTAAELETEGEQTLFRFSIESIGNEVIGWNGWERDS
jgi:hypothetical protein